MLKIEEEHLKLQQERAASEAAMMQAVTAFFSNMTQMFGGHLPTFTTKVDGNTNNATGAGGSGAGSSGMQQSGNNNAATASGSKTPSNPSSSCSNSPAYSHTYSNPPQSQMGAGGMNKMHLGDGTSGGGGGQHHYNYGGGMSQPSPSPSSAGPMASPASYPLSPAYQQGVVNVNSMAGGGGGGGGWYNNGQTGKGGAGQLGGVTPTSAPMAGHPFSSDILGISKNRHDTMWGGGKELKKKQNSNKKKREEKGQFQSRAAAFTILFDLFSTFLAATEA